MLKAIKNEVVATVRIMCRNDSWQNVSSIFSECYNKYNTFGIADVANLMADLASTGAAESKVNAGETLYRIRTSKFETLLDNAKVSQYHLASITGISKDVMESYCNGKMLTASDAAKIAKSSRVCIKSLSEITEKTSIDAIVELHREEQKKGSYTRF